MARAQELADSLSPDMLHKHLDKYAQQLCPVLDVFGQAYHWSVRQIEYSSDLMFKSSEILTPLYDTLSRQSILAADAPRVASFLGMVGVNYPGRPTTTILAGRRRGTCKGSVFGSPGFLVPFNKWLFGKRSASGRRLLPGSCGQGMNPAGAVHRLDLWADGLSMAGAS